MKKNVVLEGLGECGRNRWLPVLIELVKQGQINLAITDVVEKQVPEGSMFINKSVCSEEAYAAVRKDADIAIVVTSNDSHVNTALSYPRYTKILIDKPLSVSAKDGERLLDTGNIFVIDHYLAKSQDCIPITEETPKKLDFFLCESVLVEPMRLDTLQNGMVEDLLHHILSCTAEYISKVSATPLLDVLEGMSLKKAVNFQYSPKPDDPYYGDTSSVLTFQYGEFEIKMVLGKGLGEEKKQFVIDDIVVNYKKNLITKEGVEVGKLLSNPHNEILNHALTGNISYCPGLLSIQEAIRILELNEEAQKASNLVQIPIGISIESLLELAKS